MHNVIVPSGERDVDDGVRRKTNGDAAAAGLICYVMCPTEKKFAIFFLGGGGGKRVDRR